MSATEVQPAQPQEPSPTAAADAAEVRAVVMESGTSFLAAMRMLPKARREGMYAIYAFCRMVDDVVDEPKTKEQRDAELAWWRAEVVRVYQGRPTGAIGREMLRAVQRFDLVQADFEAVIDGMAMDADVAIRGPSMADLDLYCARVAGAVGLLSVRVFGAGGAYGARMAEALGRALQLTNILRDLGEDAELGRLYLPAELLDRHGIRTRDPKAVIVHPALPGVCRDLAEQAQSHFRAARAAMDHCPRRAVRPARVMMEVYRRILDRLLADGWRNPARKVSLPKATKLWVALRYGLV
ncbi:presqualene diphosphate synthase HpnD [Zavarzinia sp. CC-PAN008]|uniref:presqualene diphosphate synthase HpnD n=1 Tax=Zavarzinia sp. CC-PAN008 TaxID=3243332 RepID=UPI003F747383